MDIPTYTKRKSKYTSQIVSTTEQLEKQLLLSGTIHGTLTLNLGKVYLAVPAL